MSRNYFSFFFFLTGLFFLSCIFIVGVVKASLTCAVGASCANTTIFRISATSNAHGQMPSQSTYSQLVCCSGPSGLSTSCTGNTQTALKFSGTTNAHAQQNTQSGYANNVCISSTSGTFTIAYQANNCTGYDTTIASMSGTTNAHLGDSAAYTTKICGTHSAGSGAFDAYASSSVSFNSSLPVIFTSQTSTLSNAGAVKVYDDRGSSAGWTLNLTSRDWKSGQDVMQMDYNGGGFDDNLGKLCAFGATATLYAESGSMTGVTKGGNDCFSASVSTIDLVTASNGNGNGTYWLTDLSLAQFIPSNPTAAVYTTTIIFTLSYNDRGALYNFSIF